MNKTKKLIAQSQYIKDGILKLAALVEFSEYLSKHTDENGKVEFIYI